MNRKENNAWHGQSIDKTLKIGIITALYDIEVMVENLKVKSIEHWQWDIIQRIYDIHSLLSENNLL